MKKVIFALALMSVTMMGCSTEPAEMNETAEQFQLKAEELPPVGMEILVNSQDDHGNETGPIKVRVMCRTWCGGPGCGWNGYGVDKYGQIWKIKARYVYNSTEFKDELRLTATKWTGSGNPC